MTIEHLTKTKFSDFNLTASISKGLDNAGFIYCTPIQSKTLPLLLDNKDVAGQSQTGTGKTIAFLIATAQCLLQTPPTTHRKPNQPRALILVPTRELVTQIHKEAELILKETGLAIGVAYGGANYVQQRTKIEQGVDILIGTPGRLIDYFKQHVYNLKAAQVMVLDEADRMFDLGFIKDIRFIFRRLPQAERRLSMLFSATLSLRVTELAYEHMNTPELVKIESTSITADKVTEAVYYAANDEKIPLLLGILKSENPLRTIIFVNTKRSAETVTNYIKCNHLQAGLLSGDIPQKKRQRLLEAFQQGNLPILVATDVAARGLHIPEVSHVINYDLPQSAEDYVHRIGRTGRAGASGKAISFACEDYAFHLPEIEEYIGHKIVAETINTELLLTPLKPVKRSKPKSSQKRKPNPTRRRRPQTSKKTS